MSDKISREMGEQEFQRFAELWDIETNTDRMNEQTAESFNTLRDRVVRAVCSGRATIEDDGSLSYTLREPVGDVTELTFRVPMGSAYMEMDNYKTRQSMRMLYAFLGAMTKQSSKVFVQMNGIDVKFAQGIATLFLGS